MTPFVIVRLIVGAALLVAAALKGHQLATEPVDGGSLLSSRWFLIAAVECEFAMAAWLLTGFAPSLLRWVAPVFFCALGGVALAKALAGEASCGCLGRWRVSPWAAVAFDVAALTAICVCSRRIGVRKNGGLPRWVAVTGCALLAIVALPAGVAMARYEPARLADDGRVVGVGRHVALEPESWVGRRFPLCRHLELAGDVEVSRWILVFVHAHCGRCQEAASRYREIADELSGVPNAPRLALVALPGDPLEADSFVVVVGAMRDSLVVGRLSDQFTWHVTTPLELSLQNGTVTRVRTAHVPHREDFADL